MFQLQPDPTFDADVQVTRPGGGTDTLRVTFHYLDEDDYARAVADTRAAPLDVFAARLVADWRTDDGPAGAWVGMPVPCNAEGLEKVRAKQPRVLQAMIATWLHEVKGLPLKN